MMSKLSLNNRAQAVVLAYESGLNVPSAGRKGRTLFAGSCFGPAERLQGDVSRADLDTRAAERSHFHGSRCPG
jgi:hypothetical protein